MPGHAHFPKGLDDEFVRGFDERYFSGLTSTKRIAKRLTGNFHNYVWKKPSGRSAAHVGVLYYAVVVAGQGYTTIKIGFDIFKMASSRF